MVQNIDLREQIKEMLETLIEASKELKNLLEQESKEIFFSVSRDMIKMCMTIAKYAEKQEEKYYEDLWKNVENVRYSLMNIIQKVNDNRYKMLRKIEYELEPMCRMAYIQFCYSLKIGEQKKELKKECLFDRKLDLFKNFYVEKARETGKYKYELTIFIRAYNKLEYTKRCVESIIENLPKGISYELILINHGSSDGTKEYFESIHPHKQLDFKYNGGGFIIEYLISEGKYIIGVSNDVIITHNTFEIMYYALERDSKIGLAVPMTSNISNLQVPNANKISIKYNDIVELNEVTDNYNNFNPKLEEVRFRLCTPLHITRNIYTEELFIELLRITSVLMFPDDMISMFWRRRGYKNVLLKDVYCHHYGSLTINDSKLTMDNYNRARRQYLDIWEMDPWGKGMCWNYELFDTLVCDKKDASKILGIDCGMGSNPLKIQQQLKEEIDNASVEMVNFTRRDRYKKELEGISDKAYLYNNWNDLYSKLKNIYDYIIVEELYENEDYQQFIIKLYDKLELYGKLIVFVTEKQENIERWISNKYRDSIDITDKIEIMYEIDDTILSDTARFGRYMIISKV